MSLITDLEEFIHDHRPHGTLTGDATEPAWNGYLLTVACPCGVVFERWVTPQDAAVDLLLADLRAGWKTKPERCYATGEEARQDRCRRSKR